MKKELACVRRRATNEANLHGSFTFVAGLAASWDVGDQPVPAQTVGASRDDLRIAERRGQESLPFPVLRGYRPMHCLEGLLSGGRTASRTRVYIHTLARYQSPPQPRHGGCRLCQPSLFQQGVVGAFAEGFGFLTSDFGVGKSQDLGC